LAVQVIWQPTNAYMHRSSYLVSVLALAFLTAPFTAFFALLTFPEAVFLILGLVSFLTAGFFGAVFLVPAAFLVGTGSGAVSTIRGLELPVAERVFLSVVGI